MFDINNNAICPPYPKCIEYIGIQDRKACGNFVCPDGYLEIDGECYAADHIVFLESLIDNNVSLEGLKPLNVVDKPGHQKWINGRLDQLILSGRGLTDLPESICSIYQELSVFDISNNSICPSYLSCVENMGYQNTDNCKQSIVTCPDVYVLFDEQCYYYKDLAVLIDFTSSNPSIENYHPLKLGYQSWKDNRLQLLFMSGMNITTIPESIHNLDHLEHLNISHNNLMTLPNSLCEIYPNLKGIDLTFIEVMPMEDTDIPRDLQFVSLVFMLSLVVLFVSIL